MMALACARAIAAEETRPSRRRTPTADGITWRPAPPTATFPIVKICPCNAANVGEQRASSLLARPTCRGGLASSLCVRRRLLRAMVRATARTPPRAAAPRAECAAAHMLTHPSARRPCTTGSMRHRHHSTRVRRGIRASDCSQPCQRAQCTGVCVPLCSRAHCGFVVACRF